MSLKGRLRFRTPLVGVVDVTCRAGRSGPGEEEHNAATDVVLVRRGVFRVQLRGETLLADPGSALVFAAGDPFRVGHPTDGGDRCTVLRFTPELLEEALGPAVSRAVRLPPVPGPGDDEQALHLLVGVAGAPTPRATPLSQRRAAAVRELLAAEPGASWRIGEIARELHVSPYHLARQFRAATGTTIRAHLLSLRLALAVERLEEGEEDLARLAADLGFASHSHLSARFRERLGRPPSRMRTSVTAPRPGAA